MENQYIKQTDGKYFIVDSKYSKLIAFNLTLARVKNAYPFCIQGLAHKEAIAKLVENMNPETLYTLQGKIQTIIDEGE